MGNIPVSSSFIRLLALVKIPIQKKNTLKIERESKSSLPRTWPALAIGNGKVDHGESG